MKLNELTLFGLVTWKAKKSNKCIIRIGTNNGFLRYAITLPLDRWSKLEYKDKVEIVIKSPSKNGAKER